MAIAFRSVPPALRRSRLAWPGDLPTARAACGMGFVATPGLGHEAVALGAQALARLAHRGGLDADGKSGDGAGLLIQVPHRLLGGNFAVAALFEWEVRGRQVFADAAVSVGIQVADWRSVPVDPETLGGRARETMPTIWHGLIANTGLE